MKAFIAFVRRPEITTLILFACVLVSGPVLAQGDPGPNVNLIGLTPDADDIPDCPQKRHFRIDVEFERFSVDIQCNHRQPSEA